MLLERTHPRSWKDLAKLFRCHVVATEDPTGGPNTPPAPVPPAPATPPAPAPAPEPTPTPPSPAPKDADYKKLYEDEQIKRIALEKAENDRKLDDENKNKTDKEIAAQEKTAREKAERENLILKTAIAKGLPLDLTDRVVGNTLEEVASDIDKLLVVFKGSTEPPAPVLPGGKTQPANPNVPETKAPSGMEVKKGLDAFLKAGAKT